MPNPPQPPVKISIVIPVWNEADTIDTVLSDLADAFDGAAGFEVLCINDGSDDATADTIRARMTTLPWLRLVHHQTRSGKSAGLRTAALYARGDWIVTMDGDGQNLASDIRTIADRVAALSDRPSPLLAGVRVDRQDTRSRLIASRIANPIRRWALGDDCPDSGCGVKAYRRDAFLLLPTFEGMHRFLPALFKLYGHPVVLHPIAHRARLGGVSKYSNWRRAFVGVFDLIGVLWLRRRTRLPAVEGDGRIDGAWAQHHDPR